MSVKLADEQAMADLIRQQSRLYDEPEIDEKLEGIIKAGRHSKLSNWDIHRLLRTSRSVMFDTHVEVVSGHHTETYLRFESITRFPELMKLIVRDMAAWIRDTFATDPLTGIIATSSSAQLLAEGVADVLRDQMRLCVALTPYNCETGRIGIELKIGSIRSGERFVALNDVTTRGNCVSKLGKVATDHEGVLAGMMVFARRDSGQFPLMDELTAQHPFYYTTDLHMPQWEADRCPLCRMGKPLLSWRDMPKL